MITLTPDTARYAAVTDARFLIVDRAGRLHDRNEFGKALPYAYQQRPAADMAARRANRCRDNSVVDTYVVWDVRSGHVAR